MGTLNGGKKKRYHKCMNSKSVKSYLNQHIELFGDQIYKESQRTKKATFNYLDSKIDTIDSFKRAIKNCEECNPQLAEINLFLDQAIQMQIYY